QASNPSPVQVTALSGAQTVSTGDGHACAIVTGAQTTTQCWGDNGNGQLGAAVGADSTVPVIAGPLGTPVQLSAANRFTCVLEDGSGQPKCFGFNLNGLLGNGTNASSSAAVAVSGLTTATQVAAGGAFSTSSNEDREHACAVRSDATVACWGRNAD